MAATEGRIGLMVMRHCFSLHRNYAAWASSLCKAPIDQCHPPTRICSLRLKRAGVNLDATTAAVTVCALLQLLLPHQLLRSIICTRV